MSVAGTVGEMHRRVNTLVIIPSLHHKYSFSAPLAWLFAGHTAHVRGIYGEDLCSKDLQGIELCIVELNWFVELCEFEHIVAFIRRHNAGARILFGGLYAQLKYREIFKRNQVDYFIKGFAERPMRLLLEGQEPRTIPNLVGRDFENPTTYVPSQEELRQLEYDLDWFPDYFRYWSLFPAPGVDMDMSFKSMPLFPSYRYPKTVKDPSKTFRVPPRGGRYHLPMIVTARGGCRTLHEGCSGCMGAKTERLAEIFGCGGVVLDNDTVKSHLRQIARKFDQVTLYINSPFIYDFSGEHYDLDATIEVDCPITPAELRKILPAFARSRVHLVLNREGHSVRGVTAAHDFRRFIELQNEQCRIYFFATKADANAAGLPHEHRLYSEFVFPKWAHWDFYNDFDKALRYSRRWFAVTRQYNLLPFPRSLFMSIGVRIAFTFIYLVSRLKIAHPHHDMLFGDPV